MSSKVPIDDKMLFKYVSLAEKLLIEQIPAENDFSYVFSKGFEHKMNKLIRKNKRSDKYKNLFINLRRVAVLFIIIATLTFTTVLSVEAYRIKFFNEIIKIYKELTSIIFVVDEKVHDVQFEIMKPQYIPDGFEEIEMEQTYTTAYIVYSNHNNIDIIFEQDYITNDNIIIDTEDKKLEMIQINNSEVQYFYNKGSYQFIWYYDKYAFSLISTIDKSELVKMIESIK